MTRIHHLTGGLALATLLCAVSVAAQEEPILRFEGRVTYVSPWEMLVEIDGGPVVMLDVARIPQGELRQLAQNDWVVVTGFVRRPSRRVYATDIRRASPWVPTVPGWAPQSP